jgi:hypothetical protein
MALGTPALSSAATVATATSAMGPSLLAKLAVMGAGVALAASGGIAGVLLGTRQLKRQARSIVELEALRRFEFYSVGLVLLTTALFPITWQLTHNPWSQVLTFAGFIVGLAGLHLLWLPRILRSRHEIEAFEDPLEAARARQMERRAARLGWSLGLLFGTLGLVAGLVLTG